MHPVRTVKNAVTPRPVKQIRRVLNPIDTAVYAMERDVATGLRSGSRKKAPAPVYQHGVCPVRHRSVEAAQRCRNA